MKKNNCQDSKETQNLDTEILLSALPNEKERILGKLREEFIMDSSKTLTDAAKQVITIIPIIISIYSFSIGYVVKNSDNTLQSKTNIIFIIPILMLILSLISSMISIIPKHIKVSLFNIDDIELIAQKRVKRKYGWVITSYVFLIISLVSLPVLFFKL